MHKFDLQNKTAVITGGAQGFGLDIAKKFLSSGAKVNLWDIDKAQLNKAKKIVNDANLAINLVDVTNFKNVQKVERKLTKN